MIGQDPATKSVLVAMDEESEDAVTVPPTQRTKRWHYVVGLLAVGALCALAGTTRRSTQVPYAKHLINLHNYVSNIVGLAESEKLTTHTSFLWQETGKDSPSKMGVEVSLSTAEEQGEPALQIVFNSQPGQAEALEQKIKSIFKAYAKIDGMMCGEESAEMVNQMLDISAGEGDSVAITVKFPPPPEDAGKAMEHKPSLTISLKTGRDLDEMYANPHDNLLVLPAGVFFDFSTSLPIGLLEELAAVASQAFWLPPEDTRMLRTLASMVKMSISVEERYRSPDDTGAAFDGQAPPFEAALKQLESDVRGAPESLLRAIKGIEDLADGLDTVSLLGLPHNYQLVATFDNFHITPVLAKMIDDLEASDEKQALPINEICEIEHVGGETGDGEDPPQIEVEPGS